MISKEGLVVMRSKLSNCAAAMVGALRRFVVGFVYADHNLSASVKAQLAEFLDSDPVLRDGVGLNVGSGTTAIASNIINLDLQAARGVDVVGSALSLPIRTESIDFFLSQEVLEHVPQPNHMVAELFRITKIGGRGFVQVPFMISYHPCPSDYYRFTDEGLFEILQREGFRILEIRESVGAAVGFYRILVEFFAVSCSAISVRLYIPAKGFAALVFYPLKGLDKFLSKSPHSKKIAGGFVAIVQKP